LPTATARLQADITHNIGQIPELSQIALEYQRLRRISGESHGTDPQLAERFELLQAKVERATLASELTEISHFITGKGEQNESE
jgi:hypothetical protein